MITVIVLYVVALALVVGIIVSARRKRIRETQRRMDEALRNAYGAGRKERW